MYCKILILYIFICISSLQLSAQERVGLSYGSYNGISASFLNPSYLIQSKNNWEIQIAGAHTFFDTNYGSIYNTSLIDVILNNELVTIPDVPYDEVTEAQAFDVIFNSDLKKTFFDGKTDIIGPGGFYKIREDIAIGISSKFRGSLTSFGIPSSLNYFNVKDLPGNKEFEANTFQINALAWSEYGLHYAQSISKFDFGITLKYINAYTSFSFDNNFDIDYTEKSDTLIALNEGQFTLAHPVHGEQPDVVGKGLSFDLGINYRNEDGSYIGFSIIDLGYANLNGKNYIIDFAENQSIVYDDYKSVKTIDDQIAQMIQDGFAIDSTEGHFITLPAAISIQYQKTLNNTFGVQAHWVQNLKLSDYQVLHSNSLTVSGTYDKKHFSAFLPITMYNYNHVRIGAAFRIGFLTIGSDRVFSLFGKKEKFNGSDFYINLKFYPFKFRSGEESKVNCFSF